ncbi:GntR family transcriptional regulator [Microbacterium sp. MPKO10]|uniref:GntR family transcriptional regulator n=1 Tax=Microbacterium sp. MPKO10 TaxID=2989818 RepID=UPI0022363ED3|nr:GntR family transcriptional regulator [Microbacterium sp. MPKO10]MCW4459928.1 GntR family transcriptional regulator [Microbacterium sp. MPKO10]
MSGPARQTKHTQVREYLVELISAGLKPDQRLPTEREVAEQLGVTRVTVRKALDDLEKDHLVYRIQGAGTFVSEPRISKTFEFHSFSEDMLARDLTPGSSETQITLEGAGGRIGFALGLSPAEEVVHIMRVRTADGRPMCLEHSYVPAALVPGLADGMNEDSLYRELRDRFGIRPERADQTIHAVVLDEPTAELLRVPPFSPAFNVQRTAFDQRGRAIEYAESLYRGDRYSYDLSINRLSS